MGEETVLRETGASLSEAGKTDSGWRSRARTFVVGRSLAECIESGRDNILQLRLVAALMVIFGHSFVLVGPENVAFDPLHRIVPPAYTHQVGVMVFFAISGFLVTLSYLRRPDLLRFLRARALRLWPALIVCAAVWSFVLGPILSTLPVHDYFAKGDNHGTAFLYFRKSISLLEVWPFLPGLFAKNPVPFHVNASLWTIPYEAKMYVGVAVFGVTRLLRFPRVASLLIALFFAWLVLWPMYTGVVSVPPVTFFGFQLAGFFGAGAIACLLRRHVPISTGLMVLIAVVCLLMRTWIHATPLMWLAVGYFVFWFSYVPRIPSIPKQLDLSYGTYLWAFPTQQTVMLIGGVTNPIVLFAIVTPIVLSIATFSWLCIEKPALRLKNFRWRRAAPVEADGDRGALKSSIPVGTT
jgi:peptidoglycan/LPS O-acetylase OafA/YrhL